MARSRTEHDAEPRTLPTRATVTDILTDTIYRAIVDGLARHRLLRKGVAVKECAWCRAVIVATYRTKHCSDSCKVAASRRNAADRAAAEDTARKPAQPRQRPEAPTTPLPAPRAARRPVPSPDDDCPPDCADRARYRPAGTDGSYTQVFCARHDPAPSSFEPIPETPQK